MAKLSKWQEERRGYAEIQGGEIVIGVTHDWGTVYKMNLSIGNGSLYEELYAESMDQAKTSALIAAGRIMCNFKDDLEAFARNTQES